MKTLKKTLAILLAAVIVITGGAFAFAESAPTLIEWEFEDVDTEETYKEEFLYVGEAKEGTFVIKEMKEYENVYYTFNVTKAGYYVITYNWYPVDWCAVAETYENGKVTGEREYFATDSNGDVALVYYLEEGINYIGFNLYEEDSSDSYASIEFLGAEITDVKFDESEIQELLIGAEIFEYEYEEGFYWWSDTEIVFGDGKTISLPDYQLVFEMGAPLEKGEIELTLKVLDYSKTYVVTAYEITDVVSGARVVEEEAKKAEIYYNGSINYDKLDGMTLEVEFVNGEKVTAPINYSIVDVPFPNGKTFGFEVYYSAETDDEIYIIISAPYGEKVISQEKCETTEASKESNKEALKNNISFAFDWIGYNFSLNIYNIAYAGSVGEIIAAFFYAIGESFTDTQWAFSNLFTQLMAYIAYSLSL